MALTKEQRQRRIQEIISREAISTQAELVKRLNDEGMNVTQATISRDINELRLVRLPIGKSKHRYALAHVANESDVMDELAKLFRSFVRDMDRGENIIVIKTAEGHANGVAYLIDKLTRDDIIGTLAGQDTIMLVARTVKDGENLLEELSALLVS
ncbi:MULTISPECIES: arginine repressor [Deinococcus]|uniref:Arginine repressor n=2 Tax=Deinococcus TaxID=1298 RepID=A0A511N494_DEIC1|nr:MULTISPECIES: arginine repressor [Deinococcus]GEM47693.1 arginine repressor [Deinococcus cellulosilyticus NBRC 106333 = KACC 11606]GGJ37919.1 arginine repressor [Deinococcus roseus]